MDTNTLPSKKPRFDTRLDFELGEKADMYCDSKGWKRSHLVREAIAQYLAENKVVVPLDSKDLQKLQELADEHNRPVGYEGREAITQYLRDHA